MRVDRVERRPPAIEQRRSEKFQFYGRLKNRCRRLAGVKNYQGVRGIHGWSSFSGLWSRCPVARSFFIEYSATRTTGCLFHNRLTRPENKTRVRFGPPFKLPRKRGSINGHSIDNEQIAYSGGVKREVPQNCGNTERASSWNTADRAYRIVSRIKQCL